MVKIVHSGDIHLDCAYIGFPTDKAKIRAEEQLLSFQRIISKVQEEKADILLLSGDLFENDFVTYKTAAFLKREFEKISDVHIFISPGNHDCISGNEIYKNFDLGENVTVFSPKLSYEEIAKLNVRVYGYGFSGKDDSIDISAELDDKYINILLIHASLPPYSDTNPISRDALIKSGYDYIAAGHIHAHEGFIKYGSSTVAYCGTPEGRYFDECGEKGFIVLDISKDEIKGQFIKNSYRITDKIEIDVSDCFVTGDIIEKLGTLNKNNVYEIVLCGTPSENAFFESATIENALKDKAFFVKVKDKTEKRKAEFSGITQQKFIDALNKSGASEKIIKRAAEIGILALSGEEIK